MQQLSQQVAAFRLLSLLKLPMLLVSAELQASLKSAGHIAGSLLARSALTF
jgi:hypothetical protein